MEESKARKLLESKATVAGDKKKKRRFVEWTPEEDDILRREIEILGTGRWTAIASKFEGKTSRQCRRRWLFCLNTDLKTRNWSPEEDELLCQAQKKYGNRWTEIAKVFKGRTDNAAKNRFKALCEKRQASAEENIDENSKRSISNDVGSRSKKPRVAKRPGPLTKCSYGNASDKDPVHGRKQQLRPIIAELSRNIQKSDAPETSTDGDRNTEGSSKSLATELITLRTKENTGNASNEVQDRRDFLRNDEHSNDENSPFEQDFVRLLDDLLMDVGNESNEAKTPDIGTSDQEEIPANVIRTPLFKTLAASIPSPQFSPSERHYLMKALGIESPSLEKTTNRSESPSCRRSLVHSL